MACLTQKYAPTIGTLFPFSAEKGKTWRKGHTVCYKIENIPRGTDDEAVPKLFANIELQSKGIFFRFS
jgi:hypothetical protein